MQTCFLFRIELTVLQVLADTHGAEIGTAHRAVFPVEMVSGLVVFQSTVGVESQVELVFPSEFVTGLTQGIVSYRGARMAFGDIGGVCGNLIGDHTRTHVFFVRQTEMFFRSDVA